MDRQLNFKIKQVGEAGLVEGFAAIYGNKDLNGDIIEPGSFSKTLSEGGNTRPLLWQHKMDEPVGLATLSDSPKGLEMSGQIEMGVEDGVDAYMKVSKGLVRGLSIGYRVVKEVWDDAERAFRLLEIKLLEVSLVTIPANPLTLITNVKNSDRVREYAALLEECKAGRVLSASNRTRIQQVISDLQALLAEADAAAADPQEPLKHSIGRLTAILRA